MFRYQSKLQPFRSADSPTGTKPHSSSKSRGLQLHTKSESERYKKSQAFPRWQPDSSTHITLLWPYCPQKSWLKFVSLKSVLLSSSISTLRKLPLGTRIREHRNSDSSQGRAHGVNTCCLPARPSALSDAGDLISSLRERARRKERRGRRCPLSPRLSRELGALVLQPRPSSAPGAALYFLFLLCSAQWTAGFCCTRALSVTVSQAGLCPETKLEAQAQDYLLITKPPQLA